MTCTSAFSAPTVGRMDSGAFRKAMGRFATGVAVVTTADEGTPFGMTVNSLTSVSLDPCLLLACSKRGSATGDAIKRRGAFAVNILEEGQQEICLRFVGESAPRFRNLDLLTDGSELPLLPDSLAHILCRLHAIYPGGDHDIIVGEAVDCRVSDGKPLLFHGGQFCKRAA